MRTGGRAAQVVERILSATVEELSRAGYAAMRVEDIATRSGVNKTTIFRRWPTKAKLVAAAMSEHGKQRPVIDTGTLRGDLRASLLGAFTLQPSERGVLRMMQAERTIPEVESLARRFRDEVRKGRLAMVRRGITRGELPKDVNAQLVVDLVSAPVQRALLFNETLTARYVDQVLDLVLAGAAATAATKAARKRPSAGGRQKKTQ